MKAPRGLKQAHEHHAQRNLLERTVEIGFTDRADGCLERVNPGVRRHPARLQVQLGHALVVAPEKSGEVLRQVFLVHLGERAHDAKVQRDVAPKGFGLQADLDVARVHVGVEKTVAKHLGEENRHTVARQLLDVDTGLAQALHLVDRYALHALHDQHLGRAEIPHHLGDEHQIHALHIAPQLGGVGGLAQHVELVVQIGVELGHHLARLEAFAVG